jgi:hypothetical protein
MPPRKYPVETRCDNWDGLTAAVQEAGAALNPDSFETIWFRGCRESEHKLIPTLMRDTRDLSEDDQDQCERDLFSEFQARATELRQRGLSDWEYLFYGRHYGVPTRVLDWTDTFGVALYFALEEWIVDTPTGRGPDSTVKTTREPTIWIVNPYALNRKTWEDEIIQPKYLGLDKHETYWDFGELLDVDEKWPWDGPVAIYPIQINERVRAQRGWFTIHGNDRRALEDQFPKLVRKIVLERTAVDQVREFLQHAGFNRFSMYPDLDNLAIWIRENNLVWVDRLRSRSLTGKGTKKGKKKS